MIRTIQAELTKAFTVRSIQATFAAALLAPPVLALASGLAFDPAAPTATGFPTEAHGFETAGFGQPLVILLAALIVGGEYLDSALRTSLLATPRRARLFAAKLIVVVATAASAGLIATTAAVLVERTVLAGRGMDVGDFSSGIVANIATVALNYSLIAVIAAGLTALARTFIVTLVVLVPLVLGITVSLVGMLPLLKFLPDLAGIQLLTAYPGIGLLEPLPGGVVMAAWAAVFAGASLLFFVHRDTGSGARH